MTTSTTAQLLTQPHGGTPCVILVPPEGADKAFARAGPLPSLQPSGRSVCDLELLACGAFSPLDRFMGQADGETRRRVDAAGGARANRYLSSPVGRFGLHPASKMTASDDLCCPK